MSPLLLAGIGGTLIGAGAWVLIAMRWARPSLADLLTEPPPPRPAPSAVSAGGWAARLGSRGIPVLAAMGLPTKRTRARLLLCERDIPSYLAEKTTTALVGVALPPLVGAVATVAGVPIAPLPGFLLWALAAGVLWLAPDLSLRDEAAKRRTEMRQTVAAFADLAVVALAGGAGVSGALDEASRTGGTAMARIRIALRAAALRRDPPWSALRELGDRYDLDEFNEIAASLQLAGTDGARVRASLAAKARSLRTRHLAALDAQAQAATERMSLPVVLLFAGFLVLVGYPALSLILTSL
ncbi:type II secretion system F family protein [Nocardiopsis sp. RSe5-2]|uniref:Type II secretion system F family protein n=1 Tax=Nocardiopsis endophytica TaxID=3018445 RepID=A0ABT4TYZ4_9ACTN|nr:type II secretion system F family protein [Nocardiopsis endophytica]MDA2809919.1 type II secretion system F family protein [Nocardiopsis endophytica]